MIRNNLTKMWWPGRQSMVSWACLWLTPVAKDCPCSLFDSQCEQSLFVNPDVLKDCLSPWASSSPIMIHPEVDPLDSRTTSPFCASQPTSLFEELPEESSVLKKSSLLIRPDDLWWRRQWHPTPVLLPRKSHGWRSLVGCSPWGR